MSDENQDVVNDLPSAQTLSAREELFCVAYASCFNGRMAYNEAFGSDILAQPAAMRACLLLKRQDVRDRIAELVEDRKKRFELSGDIVLHELMCLAFASIADFLADDGTIDLAKLASAPPTLKRAIESIENTLDESDGHIVGTRKIKLKMHSKLKALELLGRSKNLKLFSDSVEVSDPNGEPLRFVVNFKKPNEPDEKP